MENEMIKQIYDKHFDTVYRVCFLLVKNEADAKDMTQETFYRLIKHSPLFESDEKAKAWLIVTASNCCKTLLKKWWYKRSDADGDFKEEICKFSDNEILKTVLSLDKKYSIPTYLYYYEGYKTAEIAQMLNEKQSTVQTRLAKAREILKIELSE